LHLATWMGQKEVVKLLLEKGAIVHIANRVQLLFPVQVFLPDDIALGAGRQLSSALGCPTQ
jgi:hypothetical protein